MRFTGVGNQSIQSNKGGRREMKKFAVWFIGISFLLGVGVCTGVAQMKQERKKDPGTFPKEQHTIHINKEQDKTKDLQKEVDTLKTQQKGSGAVAAQPAAPAAAEKAAVTAAPAQDTKAPAKSSKKGKKAPKDKKAPKAPKDKKDKTATPTN
jgi:hypothetical protein